jgi:TH1 protein
MLQPPALLGRTCGACSPGWRAPAAAPRMQRCAASCMRRASRCTACPACSSKCCSAALPMPSPLHTPAMLEQLTLQVAALLVELLTGASGEVQRVSRLRQMYAAQHPPPVELLQQPQVLAKLVHSIFGAKPLPADALEATAAVAALAAAAIDDRCDWDATICSGGTFAQPLSAHTLLWC